MKKFIFGLILFVVSMFSFTSCVSPAYAQGEVYDDNVDVSVVVRYGTPYYYNGYLLYYMYDRFYYYPYVRNNRYYYYRYSRPLPHPRGVRHFEPAYHNRPHVVNHYQPRCHSNFGGNRGSFNRGGSGNHVNRHFGGRR